MALKGCRVRSVDLNVAVRWIVLRTLGTFKIERSACPTAAASVRDPTAATVGVGRLIVRPALRCLVSVHARIFEMIPLPADDQSYNLFA